MNRETRLAWTLSLIGLLWCEAVAAQDQPQEQYEVLPHESSESESPSWHLWASEGPIDVSSGNQSYWGNRFRLGGEVHFGPERHWALGLAFLDFISSQEATPDVGGISRAGTDLSAGYFFVPDRFWIMYSLHLEDLRGSRISGGIAAVGHQLSVGYRVLSKDGFGLSVDLSYLYVASESVSFIDLKTGSLGSATFPTADVVALGLRISYDFAG